MEEKGSVINSETKLITTLFWVDNPVLLTLLLTTNASHILWYDILGGKVAV